MRQRESSYDNLTASLSLWWVFRRRAPGLGLRQRRFQLVEQFERLARGELVWAYVIEHRLGGGLLGDHRGWTVLGHAEQRKVVGEPRQGAGLVAAFENLQHLLGAAGDLGREAGELGDVDAVGAVGGAGGDLVQEDDVALPFLDPHRVAGERRQLCRKRR